jgi:hypothetical protein
VIAHVLGATALGYFVWDESIYLLLDIGFLWRIYLDYEMGLLPVGVAIQEIDADPDVKTELTSDADLLFSGKRTGVVRMQPVECLIEDVSLSSDAAERTLIATGGECKLTIRASVETREITLTEASSI